MFRFRKDEEALGSVIRRLLAAYGLDDKIREERLKQAWYEVVGPISKNYTEKVSIKGRKMFVSFHSAAFRQEMMMQKTKLLEEINATAESPGFLQDIIMR